MSVIIISVKLIRRIKVGDLGDKATLMIGAIVGNTTIFTGTLPFTNAQVTALVTDYINKKTAFELGGLLQKPAYGAAKKLLVNCLIEFAKYVDTIALGNLAILHLSTLPTTENLVDLESLIAAGATAENVTGTKGIRGELLTDCKAFGAGVDYLVILSEGAELPAATTIGKYGQLNIPANTTNTVYIIGTRSKKKNFVNLLPGSLYYIYYVLIYKETVGMLSSGVEVTCGN